MVISSLRGGLWLAVGATLFVGGCGTSHPPRLYPPSIDASAAGKAAIKEYDTDGDGFIDGKELDKVPAIKNSMSRYDTGDGKVSADRITERIEKWQSSKNGVTATMVSVEMDGKPLDGATVTFDPEPFLGEDMQQHGKAAGTTNERGAASLVNTVDPKTRPGVSPGLYKVRISKIVDGKETIPARYNTETELGLEVAPDNLESRKTPPRYQLTSGPDKPAEAAGR